MKGKDHKILMLLPELPISKSKDTEKYKKDTAESFLTHGGTIQRNLETLYIRDRNMTKPIIPSALWMIIYHIVNRIFKQYYHAIVISL